MIFVWGDMTISLNGATSLFVSIEFLAFRLSRSHRMRIRVSEDFIEDKFGNSLRNMVRAENRIMHAGVGMFDVSMIVVRMQ